MENLQTKQINNYKPKINTMKKTTQNVTKSIWRSGLLAFVFLFSLSINSQNVGDEYVINSGLNSNGTSAGGDLVWGMNGNFNGGSPATSIGWTAYSSAGYNSSAATPSANNAGTCHSENRMLKLFKKGTSSGQFVTQEIEDLPSGNYNWSFYTKWGSVVDYDAGVAKKPTFTIATDDDADGTWEVVQTVIPTEPLSAHNWFQDTGTYKNQIARKVRIKFYKYGGTNAAQTNLNQLMMIDDVSLNYAGPYTFPVDDTSLSDLTQDSSTIAGFTKSGSTYDISLAQGTTVVPTIAATTNSPNASLVITAATGIPGTTIILVTAENGTTNTVSINFGIPALGVVGQEYLTNPNINTTSSSPNTGVDGEGNFPDLGGWGSGANGSYVPSNTGNGDCHSEDRMFKFFIKNDAYVTQTIELPPGIYSWSFWTKWGGLVTWDAEGDVKPKFTIMTDDDENGGWTAVQTTVTTQPIAANSWVQQTGTYTNDIQRQVRIKFSKSGGTTTEPTNLNQLMYIDDVSLKFVGSNAWTETTGTDWGTAANWSNGVPDANSEVFIPGGLSTYPIASSAVAVTSLTMGPGASFIANSDFTGAVTYNRTLGTNNWYLVSSPVGGETYDNTYVTANQIALGADPDNRGIAPYTPSDDSWDYMQSGETATFAAGNGYSVKRTFGGDISFTGTLNTDDVSAGELSVLGKRFNLLGNPYTSHIASATFLTNEAAVSETQTLWVWNQATGASGAYEVKTLAAPMVLAPAQAFFVKANAAGGTFNFAESNQASTGGTFQRTENRPEIYLTISNQTDAREAKIYYIENMTTGFDVGYEGELFNGVSNPLAIYTHLVADSEGKNYQVQSLPTNNYENMIVPVGVNAASGSAITIEASTNNFPEGLKIFLEDKQDNSFTLLDADANFNTTLENDLNGIGRFYLHTNQSVLNINDTSLDNVSVFKVNNSLRVLGLQQGKASVKLFNILGRQVLNAAFESNGTKDISLPRLAKGVYIVQLETAEGKLNKKIILE